MKNKKILDKFKFWECKRCGHIWVSNGIKLKKDKPIYCPKCKSPYWNKKRQQKIISEDILKSIIKKL